MTTDANRRFSVAAAALALGLLLAGGVGYRVLAGHLARPGNSIPLPRGSLARLPMRIGDWAGRDIPIDPAIVEATDTNDLLNRRYVRAKASQQVGLYIAYGIRARDLMPHRPEVCYPDTGWTAHGSREVTLDLGVGPGLHCRILRFSRGP